MLTYIIRCMVRNGIRMPVTGTSTIFVKNVLKDFANEYKNLSSPIWGDDKRPLNSFRRAVSCYLNLCIKRWEKDSKCGLHGEIGQRLRSLHKFYLPKKQTKTGGRKKKKETMPQSAVSSRQHAHSIGKYLFFVLVLAGFNVYACLCMYDRIIPTYLVAGFNVCACVCMYVRIIQTLNMY